MQCRECSNPIPPGVRFCRNCGAPAPNDQAAAQPYNQPNQPYGQPSQPYGQAPSQPYGQPLSAPYPIQPATGQTVMMNPPSAPNYPPMPYGQPIQQGQYPANQPQPQYGQPHYGPPQYGPPAYPQQNVNVNVYQQQAPGTFVPYAPVVMMQQKSVAVALLLTFFFGPLGMFYSTISGAVVMLIVSVVLFVLTLGLSTLITWPICMIWGAVAASQANSRVMLPPRY